MTIGYVFISLGLLAIYSRFFGSYVGRKSTGYGAKNQLIWLDSNVDVLNAKTAETEKGQLVAYLKSVSDHEPRRISFYQGGCMVLFSWLFAITPSVALFLAQLPIFSLFLLLAAIDLEDKAVPEAELLWLAAVSLSIHVLAPSVQWASSQNVVLGLFSVLFFVFAGQVVTRFLFNIDPKQIIFGDGDLFALLALALFYGLDVLIVIGLSSLFFLAAHGFKAQYKKGLSLAGYVPQEDFDKNGMAMFPFLLMGLTVMVSVSLLTSFSFLTAFEELYNYYLDQVSK